MIKIPLSQGKVAIIDDDDLHKIEQGGSWSFAKRKYGGGYAQKTVYSKGKWKTLLLHRVVLGIMDSKIKIDHINGDKLDCRKANLRIATTNQNTKNRLKHTKSTSKYKGVCFVTKSQKWRASIRFNYKSYFLGEFHSEEDAAKKYDEYALKFFGEFANLNFKILT